MQPGELQRHPPGKLPDFMQLNPYHVGYVVDDVPAAVERWVSTYGAGPFFVVEGFRLDEQYCLGERVEYSETFALGAWGSTLLELVDFGVRDASPRVHEVLSRTNTMHVGFATDDAAAASGRLESLGYPQVLWGRTDDSVTYLHDARHELGHYIEVLTDSPTARGFQELVRRAAVNWDGSDPLRKLALSALDASDIN